MALAVASRPSPALPRCCRPPGAAEPRRAGPANVLIQNRPGSSSSCARPRWPSLPAGSSSLCLRRQQSCRPRSCRRRSPPGFRPLRRWTRPSPVTCNKISRALSFAAPYAFARSQRYLEHMLEIVFASGRGERRGHGRRRGDSPDSGGHGCQEGRQGGSEAADQEGLVEAAGGGDDRWHLGARSSVCCCFRAPRLQPEHAKASASLGLPRARRNLGLRAGAASQRPRRGRRGTPTAVPTTGRRARL